MESIERLEKLAAMAAGQGHFLVGAVILVALLVIAFLVFFPVRETEIDLEAKTLNVSFGLAAPHVVVEEALMRTIGMSGVTAIRVPEGRTAQGGPAGGKDLSETNLRLEAVTGSRAPGTLRLSDVAASENTHVVLLARRGGGYRVSLEGAPLRLKVNLYGSIRIQAPGQIDEVIEFPYPKPLLVSADTSAVDLDLVPLDPAHAGLPRRASIKALSLIRVEKAGDTSQALVRESSGLLSGRIYKLSVGGEQRELREYEHLVLSEPRGELRSVRLADDALNLRFQGKVSGLTAGSLENREELMPKWLEVWRARGPVSLFLSTSVSVIALALTVLRWFKVHS
jgi:hypothetical protein